MASDFSSFHCTATLLTEYWWNRRFNLAAEVAANFVANQIKCKILLRLSPLKQHKTWANIILDENGWKRLKVRLARLTLMCALLWCLGRVYQVFTAKKFEISILCLLAVLSNISIKRSEKHKSYDTHTVDWLAFKYPMRRKKTSNKLIAVWWKMKFLSSLLHIRLFILK